MSLVCCGVRLGSAASHAEDLIHSVKQSIALHDAVLDAGHGLLVRTQA